MFPSLGRRCAKVALTPMRGFIRPKQLGPRNWTSFSFAAATSCFCSLGAVLLESGCEDGCVLDSSCLELGHLTGDECGLDRDDGEIDGCTDVDDGGVCLESLDLSTLGVDGVDGSLETSVDHVLYEHSTQLGLIVGCSDDGH